MGLIVVQEPREVATALAVSSEMRSDMYAVAAVVPKPERRIDDPASVLFLKVRLDGIDLQGLDLQGAGQSVRGDEIELRDPETLPAAPPDADLEALLRPEPLIESDAPEIVKEAHDALAGIREPRARAERLVRHVNALLEKRPTISLPSALEVLRTRVGDCNEHTALYVALARSIGIPSRIAVGLAYVRGAFYYHAWPEVYIEDGHGGLSRASVSESRGLWLPVDPTFNQFPADATHVRLMRGGLDRQAAILPMIGHIKMNIVDLELAPNSTPVLIGGGSTQPTPLALPMDIRPGATCWTSPVSRAR